MASSLFRRICPATTNVSHRPFSSDSGQPSADLLSPMALRPDFGPNDVSLPPLPEIKDAGIRQRVFTHRSLYARPTHVFEDHLDDLSPDNEKYEHLGDTVLGLSVTRLMMEMYPGLRVGPSTKIRALVVGNSTLAEISLKYKLPARLRLHPAQAITLRASPNIQADAFESFVGGLYLDQGLEVVKKWLDQLFCPYTKAAYQIVRQQHGLPVLPTPGPFRHPAPDEAYYGGGNDENSVSPNIGHLGLFNQYLQKGNRQVEWVYSDGRDQGKNEYTDMGLPKELIMQGTKSTPIWYVKVMVDGELYGRGKGSTKKAARNEAAKQGLERMGVVIQ